MPFLPPNQQRQSTEGTRQTCTDRQITRKHASGSIYWTGRINKTAKSTNSLPPFRWECEVRATQTDCCLSSASRRSRPAVVSGLAVQWFGQRTPWASSLQPLPTSLASHLSTPARHRCGTLSAVADKLDSSSQRSYRQCYVLMDSLCVFGV